MPLSWRLGAQIVVTVGRSGEEDSFRRLLECCGLESAVKTGPEGIDFLATTAIRTKTRTPGHPEPIYVIQKLMGGGRGSDSSWSAWVVPYKLLEDYCIQSSEGTVVCRYRRVQRTATVGSSGLPG